jgi:hypothetical protein
MLQDPENYDEQAITIYADSLDQARTKAEAEAQYLSGADAVVICIDCRKITKTTGKYLCVLRIEGRPL